MDELPGQPATTPLAPRENPGDLTLSPGERRPTALLPLTEYSERLYRGD